MASDHQQQQQQQQQLPTQQQPTQLTQPQQQQTQSSHLPQTNQSPSSQQQQLSQSQQQSQSQQSSLQQQAQSLHRQPTGSSQHQTSAANTLPQQTELLSHNSTPLDGSRHSGGGGGGSSSNATGEAAPHNLSAAGDPQQAQQQFCLRWNNFQSNIVNSFETLLDREELVDVTLTAEGRSLRAHRVLLSACSPYFRDLFQDVPPHQHPVIVLRDTRFLELKCLLCFIYHGEVNVSQDNLSCLLNLAENLKVKGLAQEGNKRHNSKEYEYGRRGALSPEREGDLSDGGEPANVTRPPRGGHLLRPGRSVSPPPPGVSVPFGNLSALGSLLGNHSLATSSEGGSRIQMDDHVRSRADIRESHHNSSSSKSSISLLNASQFSQHDRKDQLHVLHQQQHHHQQQQQQHHSPPSKRRKRHPSPLQHHSPSNTSSSHHHQQQQRDQQQGERFTNNSSGSQLTPPPLPLSSSHNNGGGGSSNPTAHSNSSAHTPSAGADDDGNTHAVNLSVCPSVSPPRLMVPKLELMTADDDTSNGEKERLERLEQRERICNFLGKDSIAGMISKFPGGFTDSDMEGEEEPPPPHDEENSADMEGHGPGGGLGHPLSHHLPPGLQQSFVPYPPTTHAAAAAAAAAAHHFANTFTPGPSGVPSSVSPASWRSHASDQNPNSPQVESCKRNACPLCPCTLDSVWELKDHLARRHDMKVHKCAFCGAKFREIEQMAVHVNKRHGEKLLTPQQRLQQASDGGAG